MPARRRKVRVRLDELEEQEKTAGLSAAEKDEFRAIIWPAYFADPENVMPRPPTEICEEAFEGLIAGVGEGTEEVAAALGRGDVPYGVLAGAASPFPWGKPGGPMSSFRLQRFSRSYRTPGILFGPGAVRAALDELGHADQRP